MGNVMIYKQFLAIPNFDEWLKLENQLTMIDKMYLGYPYKVWHECCFKLYGNTTHSDYVLTVTEFIITKETVINGFIGGDEWAILPMMIIYNMFNHKHRKIIDSVLTDPKISNKCLAPKHELNLLSDVELDLCKRYSLSINYAYKRLGYLIDDSPLKREKAKPLTCTNARRTKKMSREISNFK